MSTALNNKPAHIARLCERLELGNARDVPSQVAGGFHHRMWQLDTDRGRYAVKQLAPDSDLGNPDTSSHYDTTEAIAERFAGEGVPALHALGKFGHYLQRIEDAGYLVYPWTDAQALPTEDVSLAHARTLAGIMAQMHRADIVAPHPRPLLLPVAPEDKVRKLLADAGKKAVPGAAELARLEPDFLQILDAQRAAGPILERHKVISHGDLDQKNVLWDQQGQPLVIDWESAGLINPTYEILLEALDWSGITTRFEPETYRQVLIAYHQQGGELQADFIGPAFDAILGEWLDWLLYNLGRMLYLEERSQQELGAAQVESTLAIIMRLRGQMDDLQLLANSLTKRGQ